MRRKFMPPKVSLVLACGTPLFLSIQAPLPQARPAERREANAAHVPDTLRVAGFSRPLPTDSLLDGWLPLSFGGDRGSTRYGAGSRAGRGCLQAEAQGTASALVRPLEVAASEDLELVWSWWVDDPVMGGNLSTKEGDDFAARLYVNFRFDPSRAGILDRLRHRLAGRRFGGEAPGRSLVYVWGNVAAPGTVAPNAYTGQAMVVVVRSGGDGAGQWWTEERQVAADYRAAFGEEPPDITSIAIMSDADDTGASASACYGDIFLVQRFPP